MGAPSRRRSSRKQALATEGAVVGRRGRSAAVLEGLQEGVSGYPRAAVPVPPPADIPDVPANSAHSGALAAMREIYNWIVGAVALVDTTSRMEFQGGRRLDDAADELAAYSPYRARPDNVNGLRKVLLQRDDDHWVWRGARRPFSPASTSCAVRRRGNRAVRRDQPSAQRQSQACHRDNTSRARSLIRRGLPRHC